MTSTIRLSALLALATLAGAGEITEKNLRYVEYPGFPDAHSTWGSIGYSKVHDKVLVGVTNHRDRQGIYEFDVKSGSMRLTGFVADLANLRDFQWQGKIHSQIVEGPGGVMYFATDGGESREEYLMEHPHGYGGGFLFRWDPASNRLTNLGMGLQYESIKDVGIDRIGGRIYFVSYPQVHLFVYDPARNHLRDLGRVGSDHVPRVLFTDRWSNFYYVDWRQRLIKYERESDKLVFARDSLPAFPGTPGGRIVTGITAYAKDERAGMIYLITYGSKMLAFHPQQTGIGKVEDLGGIYDGPGEPYQYYCPNLALGGNGRLYYFLGGHGMYAGNDRSIALMEFDPKARTKRVVLRLPLNILEEATGSDVKDGSGNLYFAGRRRDVRAARQGESGATRPYMLMFNPQREVR
jgi:hypothetical protein